MNSNDYEIKTDIRYCARCHGNHLAMIFIKLDYASQDNSHWALCPISGEPIMLQVKTKIHKDLDAAMKDAHIETCEIKLLRENTE